MHGSFGGFGYMGATDEEIAQAIQFGPVPTDDPGRAAGPLAAVGSGAAAGALLGPIGAIVGAIAGAAPTVIGLVGTIRAKRASLQGMIAEAAKVKANLMTARRPARRQKLLAKYQGLVEKIKVEQSQVAMMEQQAAMQNLQIPPTPPYGLYAVTGLGLVALVGGGIYLLRRK